MDNEINKPEKQLSKTLKSFGNKIGGSAAWGNIVGVNGQNVSAQSDIWNMIQTKDGSIQIQRDEEAGVISLKSMPGMASPLFKLHKGEEVTDTTYTVTSIVIDDVNYFRFNLPSHINANDVEDVFFETSMEVGSMCSVDYYPLAHPEGVSGNAIYFTLEETSAYDIILLSGKTKGDASIHWNEIGNSTVGTSQWRSRWETIWNNTDKSLYINTDKEVSAGNWQTMDKIQIGCADWDSDNVSRHASVVRAWSDADGIGRRLDSAAIGASNEQVIALSDLDERDFYLETVQEGAPNPKRVRILYDLDKISYREGNLMHIGDDFLKGVALENKEEVIAFIDPVKFVTTCGILSYRFNPNSDYPVDDRTVRMFNAGSFDDTNDQAITMEYKCTNINEYTFTIRITSDAADHHDLMSCRVVTVGPGVVSASFLTFYDSVASESGVFTTISWDKINRALIFNGHLSECKSKNKKYHLTARPTMWTMWKDSATTGISVEEIESFISVYRDASLDRHYVKDLAKRPIYHNESLIGEGISKASPLEVNDMLYRYRQGDHYFGYIKEAYNSAYSNYPGGKVRAIMHGNEKLHLIIKDEGYFINALRSKAWEYIDGNISHDYQYNYPILLSSFLSSHATAEDKGRIFLDMDYTNSSRTFVFTFKAVVMDHAEGIFGQFTFQFSEGAEFSAQLIREDHDWRPSFGGMGYTGSEVKIGWNNNLFPESNGNMRAVTIEGNEGVATEWVVFLDPENEVDEYWNYANLPKWIEPVRYLGNLMDIQDMVNGDYPKVDLVSIAGSGHSWDPFRIIGQAADAAETKVDISSHMSSNLGEDRENKYDVTALALFGDLASYRVTCHMHIRGSIRGHYDSVYYRFGLTIDTVMTHHHNSSSNAIAWYSDEFQVAGGWNEDNGRQGGNSMASWWFHQNDSDFCTYQGDWVRFEMRGWYPTYAYNWYGTQWSNLHCVYWDRFTYYNAAQGTDEYYEEVVKALRENIELMENALAKNKLYCTPLHEVEDPFPQYNAAQKEVLGIRDEKFHAARRVADLKSWILRDERKLKILTT